MELAYRLVRMFSFIEDTILDPFAGTFTTTLAAMKAKRNSIGNELDPGYFEMGRRRAQVQADEIGGLFETPPLIELVQTT